LHATHDELVAAEVSAAFLSRFHYRPATFDEAFSAAVFDRFIREIDPSRSYFTQSDLAGWAGLRGTLAGDIARGDVNPAFAPVNRYLERAVENIRYAQHLLADGFDFSQHESAELDRKSAPWPASGDQLHDLWRKRAKADWLRLKLAGQSDTQIRATLGHRYDTMLRRLQQTSASDAFEMLMTACANSTDPHTDYFVPRVASRFNTEMSLSLEGIGAYLREHEDSVQVTELVAGGPAGESGKIHVGDRIVGVGQGDRGPFVDVMGMRLDDVVARIRGKAGSKVRLEMVQDGAVGAASPAHVSVIRRKVSMEDQAARSQVVQTVDRGVIRAIGVITVPSFYEDFDARRAGDAKYRSLTRDVAAMLSEFRDRQVDGVLLDLRDDGGGSLAEAASLAGLFMGPGPVVQVRNAQGQVDQQAAPGEASAWTGPVGVLVNRGSASASEIFAAAIQDRGRGLVIGERTFGKGTVQNLVDLSTFSADPKTVLGALKMTVAEFFRVNGASTQLLGVTPDVLFPDAGNESTLGESSYDNALPNSRIPALDFKRFDEPSVPLATIRARHDSRVAMSARWGLMLDELNALRLVLAKKSESLNFAERKASRESELAQAEAFRSRREAIDVVEGVAGADDDAGIDGDDGLDATERELPVRPKAHKGVTPPDARLQEAANIVADQARLPDFLAHAKAQRDRSYGRSFGAPTPVSRARSRDVAVAAMKPDAHAQRTNP
jgi:carboxyl-terminal processing protease